MNKLLAHSFIVLYLLALCRPVAPLLEYYARLDYFAEVLCVNKDKPELHCEGTCVLMTKLKEVNQPTNTTALPKIDLKEYPLGFVSGFVLTLHRHSIAIFQNHYHNSFHLKGYLQRLLKPPQR